MNQVGEAAGVTSYLALQQNKRSVFSAGESGVEKRRFYHYLKLGCIQAAYNGRIIQ